MLFLRVAWQNSFSSSSKERLLTLRKSMGSIEDKRNGGAEAGLNMELHEMLTDRLYEQVDSLLRTSSYFCHPSEITQRLLRATLSDAVHHILHLSEDEPYGVR